MYGIEHKLILELCKFLDPDREKIVAYMKEDLHWPYILGQLMFHRVGGAAYYTLLSCDLLAGVHRECRLPLQMLFDGNRAKGASMKAAMELLGESLPADMPYALLKGAYLAGLYPAGLRTSNDIDILLNKSDLARLERALLQAGFLQGNIRSGTFTPAGRREIVTSRMTRGETVPFIRPVHLPQMEYLEIDVNFSLDYQPVPSGDTVSAFLRRAQPLIHAGDTCLNTLDPADFLIHLCCHLFKEATVYAWVAMERDTSLYKFLDLYLLLHTWTDANWYRDLEVAIHRYALERECYFALLRTKELFHIEKPYLDTLLAGLCPGDTAYLQQVIHPGEGKTYYYTDAFADWVFIGRKKERLYEITDEST